MSKTEMINYLNKIRPFLNLKAVCENYNDYAPDNPLDYNNLRVVLNGISPTRVSKEKLLCFVMYIKNVLLKNVFDFGNNYEDEQDTKKDVAKIIEMHCKALSVTLIKEITDEV
ncbi:MAG: hypothetical protein IJF73_04350 [Clostridia bacterium]|nr:hypothetical protein [Clostridia bacterium]